MKTIVKEVTHKVEKNYLEFSDFEKYLKQRFLYERFLESITKRITTLDIKGHILSMCPMNVFVDSFVWCDTKQGENFWRDVDDKWDTYLKKNNISLTIWGENIK